MRSVDYDHNVFINCPFDDEYAPIFEAIVFAVTDAGFRPKCARERLDSSQVRLQKIVELIASSRYSIHDLSRTAIDTTTALPRFNMPLELGIDLGCKAYNPDCPDKSLLIFDSEQYRFQMFVSDIGGQDIHQHGNSARTAVTRVRNDRARAAFPVDLRSTHVTKSFERISPESVPSSSWMSTA